MIDTALTTRPLTARFGVEIQGVDLRDVSAGHGFDAIRAAFEQHSALLFRDQTFEPEHHLALAKLFGPIEDRKADERKPGEAFEIPQVSNRTEDGSVSAEMDLHTLNLKANQLWHTDGTFLPAPALANIITARVVTSSGGETELAGTRAAWADMPESLKTRARDALIWHRYSHSRARISEELAKLPMFHKWPDQQWRALWRNPVTGEDAVYVASHAFKVEGLPEAEGAQLIDELIAFCTRPEYVYTHEWRVGDVLIWDERATLHRGRPWPYAEERTLSSICVTATASDGLSAMRPQA
ncbi:MAG: TauD/TfdA family dioxygenase [Pseudomonadota bacterium]